MIEKTNINNVRQNTIALILAECKEHIEELGNNWIGKTKLIEGRYKEKSKSISKENTIRVNLVDDCPLSTSQKFCHSSCNWWGEKGCVHPIKLKKRIAQETVVIH
jgi:hypothetical protein